MKSGSTRFRKPGAGFRESNSALQYEKCWKESIVLLLVYIGEPEQQY